MRRQDSEEDQKIKHANNVRKVFESPIILKNIVDYVYFDGIQALRKVSRNVRQRMDEIKPDPAITSCSFDIAGVNKVKAIVRWGKNHYINWYLQYEKKGYGCIVSSPNHRIMSKCTYIAEDFQQRCLKDLEINMKHRPCFCTLTFDLSHGPRYEDKNKNAPRSTTYPFLEGFEKFYKSKSRLLKVHHLHISTIGETVTVLQQNEVMKILPFLDPKCLTTIYFYRRCVTPEETGCLIEIDEISKLKQWMNAKQLKMSICIISTRIQEMNITHFAVGDIVVQTVSAEDLRFLKEGFQNNLTLEKFKIAFKECSFDEFRNDDIYQFMGIPHVEANPLLRNQRNIWYCRTPNDNYVLHILHYVGRSITFSRVELSSIPEDVRFLE